MFANVGVVGLYLGKVFDESRRRPLYVVKDLLNFGAEPPLRPNEPIAVGLSGEPAERPFDRSRLSPPV